MSEVRTGPGTEPEVGDVSAPIWFSPHGLAGTRWAFVGFAACAAALVGVFLVGMAVPKSVETVPAALLIVVAASWLLSTRLALGVALGAVALPMAEVVLRELDPASAAVQVAVFVFLATATRLYSTRLHRLLIGNVGPPTSMAATAFGLENLARLVEGSTQGVAAIDADGTIRYGNGAAHELLGIGAGEPAPGDFFGAVAPEDRQRVRAAFAAPAAGGNASFTIQRVDGSTRTVHATHTRVVVRDEPMVALALRDVSQVNRLQRAATALAETAAALAVTQPLAQTLAAVAHRVIEVTDAAACAVFLLDGERSLRLAASWGLPSGYEAAANDAIKAGADPPVFQAMRTREPVFVEDLPDVIRTRTHMKSMRHLVRDVTWRQAIAFPMVHGGRPVGGLSVYLRPDRHLDEPTMDFLSTIAGLAASAAEISRLVSLAQDQAAANERLHLSRELHDSLSQRLYGIILGAKSIEARAGDASPQLADAVGYVVELAQGGLAEMRDIVLQLRPEALEREGLVAAVSRHADAISSRHQLQVTTALEAEPDVPLDVKLAAYRIVVEALNNVAKHASAQHAWVRVGLDGERLRLEVSDDGVGFDAAGSAPGHFGLATMRERAAAYGADLQVSTRHGGGTTVLAELPCPRQVVPA